MKKKELVEKIIKLLDFLSNQKELMKSWETGNGRFSAGFSEEITTLYSDYLFEDYFIEHISKPYFSQKLNRLINKLNSDLTSFMIKAKNYSDSKILRTKPWQLLMGDMHLINDLMRKEIDRIPD